jgi:chromosome partitioning protein
MATIISFLSQKGGVAKSTLARALAREAAKGGLLVKIADLDLQQATSLSWARRRLENGIEPAISVEPFKTAEQALAACNGLDLMILDAPARASEGTRRIAHAADLVVQPSNTSLDDLEPAILLFHEMVKDGIPRARLIFALCQVLTEPEEAAARAYIADAGYAVLKGSIPAKTSYREAQNTGRSITETRFPALNERADELLTDIIDKVDI